MKSSFLPVLFFYATYYAGGCESEIGDHVCSNCETPEHGRLRAAFFEKVSHTFTDPSDPTEWDAAIAAKDVIIIPEVNGTFDGGAEVEGTGYGSQVSKITGYNFSATYKDPNFNENNVKFYNGLKRSRNYRFGWITETKGFKTVEATQSIPKIPITENLTDEVTIENTVKWASGDLPVPFDIPPGIFEACFNYAP